MTTTLQAWLEMRDAANPQAPGLRGWQGPVQGYPNRTPPWTAADFAMFPGGHMATSVQTEPVWAHICREIDVEQGAATEIDIPDFIIERERLGHHDGGAYFSLSRWPLVRPVLLNHNITPDRIRIRIADWSVPPTRFDLGGGYVAWAHQFANVPQLQIDRTAVFGTRDFVR